MNKYTYTFGLNKLILIAFLLICADQTMASQEEIDNDLNIVSFEYQLENRIDPFLPFVQDEKKSPTLNMDEFIDSPKTLTGMQVFEADQLKVVAILLGTSKHIAMVEDTIGQGYSITLGTLIGKRGTVKEITPRGVVVEETATTRAGVQKTTKIVMALKPEGE